jgi:peptidoglycan hydrolase-like protein with peptidoglycan-binding domain
MSARLRRFLSLAVLLAALFTVLPAGAASAATPQCYRALHILPDSAGPALWLPSAGTTLESTRCWMARGNVSDGVWAMQRALIDCYGQNIAADGVFGPRTQAALVNAQREMRANPDGGYGPETRGLMRFSPAIGAPPPCDRMFNGWPFPGDRPPR